MGRGNHWKKLETKRALDLISEIKPIGADGWKEVAQRYNTERPHTMVSFTSFSFPYLD
jgi:hypothetical protein